MATSNTQLTGSSNEIYVNIEQNGQALVNNNRANNSVSALADVDQIRLVLVDNPGFSIDSLRVYLQLPENAQIGTTQITPRLVHTLDTKVARTVLPDNIVLFTAQNIYPQATFSLEIDFPKNVLKLSNTKVFYSMLLNKSLYWWIAIAMLLPIISLVILLIMLGKRTKFNQTVMTQDEIQIPPSEVPPAVVEVLLTGKISYRSITATLLDLARRGYIIIGYHHLDFRFSKHKKFDLPSHEALAKLKDGNEIDNILRAISQIKDNSDLLFFERVLLSKLFTQEENYTDKKNFEERIGHRLFSGKIALFYEEVYALSTSYGDFLQNPELVHRKFKLTGLVLFFLSLAGFAIGALFFPEPKTALFFWVGMIFVSLIIIKNASNLPIHSEQGMAELKKWRAFGNYLSNPQPLAISPSAWEKFEGYLPYAIVMKNEVQWSARFQNMPFREPNWFSSDDQKSSLASFDAELFPLLDWVGSSLSVSRAPTVD